MIIRFSNHGNLFLFLTSCSSLRAPTVIPRPSLRAPTRNPFNICEVLGSPGTPGMTAGGQFSLTCDIT